MKYLVIFIVGSLLGLIFEFTYRSIKSKKLIWPLFVNYYMYGATGVFLVFLCGVDMPMLFKILLMFIFPTLIEFLTGYLYLKIKGIYLWDYSNKPFNFMKLVCLEFSLYWFILSMACYYLFLPVFI